jgi:hypothetical protein
MACTTYARDCITTREIRQHTSVVHVYVNTCTFNALVSPECLLKLAVRRAPVFWVKPKTECAVRTFLSRCHDGLRLLVVVYDDGVVSDSQEYFFSFTWAIFVSNFDELLDASTLSKYRVTRNPLNVFLLL